MREFQGFRNDILGVTLVDMETYTGSTSGQMSLVFVCGSVVGMVGAIFLVRLHDYYNTFLLMAVSGLVYGVLVVASPWSKSVVVYIILVALGRLPHCVFSPGRPFSIIPRRG